MADGCLKRPLPLMFIAFTSKQALCSTAAHAHSACVVQLMLCTQLLALLYNTLSFLPYNHTPVHYDMM